MKTKSYKWKQPGKDWLPSSVLHLNGQPALRVGRPALHRQFDETTAVLAGDALQALAFSILTHEDTHQDTRVRCKLVEGLARWCFSMGDACTTS